MGLQQMGQRLGLPISNRGKIPRARGAVTRHSRWWICEPSPEVNMSLACASPGNYWAASPTGLKKRNYGYACTQRRQRWRHSHAAASQLHASTNRPNVQCMQILKLKKVVAIKLSIKIKFRLHHYLSYNKIFKTRPHLSMFARYFLKIFF